MEKGYLYYVVESDGPVKDAIERYYQEANEFSEHLRSVMSQYSAEKAYAGGTILGLIFEPGKPPEGWMHKSDHPKGVYSPDKRTKAGKEAASVLRKKTKPDSHTLAKYSKSSPLFQGTTLRWPTFEQVGEVFIWKVPVGTNGDQAETSLDGLRQIKTSEYWSMKENLLEYA